MVHAAGLKALDGDPVVGRTRGLGGRGCRIGGHMGPARHGLGAVPATLKLIPHFLHLIRAPTSVGGILPRSPQEGHATKGIVSASS